MNTSQTRDSKLVELIICIPLGQQRLHIWLAKIGLENNYVECDNLLSAGCIPLEDQHCNVYIPVIYTQEFDSLLLGLAA